RNKRNKASDSKDVETKSEPRHGTTSSPDVAVKVAGTERAKEVVAPKSKAAAAVTKLETVDKVLTRVDTTKTEDDLISWDDPITTNEKVPIAAPRIPAKTALVFEDEIDIFADDDDTNKPVVGNNTEREEANVRNTNED